MFAPVLTIASTMLLRIMSTKTFFRPGADQRAGQAEDHAALLVAEHAVVDVGGAGQVAGAEGHVLHRLDERHDAGRSW